MVKVSTLDREETRKKIINASREIFYEYGFKDAQVKDIAKASGIGTSTLYGYFPSKLELFISAYFVTFDEEDIDDVIIEKELKNGLIDGLYNIMIRTVKISTKHEMILIKNFFLSGLLESMKENTSKLFCKNRNIKINLLLKIFEVYERTHVKMVPFSVLHLCERILNSFTMTIFESIILDSVDLEMIKDRVVEDLRVVLIGKYPEII